jgi:colicin import membrane protein/protein TonB
MSGAGTSALSHSDRLWPAVVASLVVHAGFFTAFAAVRPGPSLDPGQRPITARLVRLGELRPKELLPRKEAPPPPEATAPVEAPPAPSAPPAPAPVAAPAARSAPAPKPAAAARPDKPSRPGGSRLAGVVSQLQREIQAGDPGGDPLGEAGEAEGDQYLAAVRQALRQNYRLPSTISERERLFLQATLVLSVARDGRILSWEFTKRSGNPIFDEALERAVRQTRLPPPPAAAAATYLKGFEVDFKI